MRAGEEWREGSGRIQWAELFLALIAAGTVLSFGGARHYTVPPSYTAVTMLAMQSAVAILAAIVLWRRGLPDLPRAAAVFVGVLLVLPLLQMIPLPRFLVRLLSPARLALHDQILGPLDLGGGAIPITINSYATQVAYWKIIAYALVFLLGYQFSRNRRGGWLAPRALVAVGVFEAGYGIIQYLTGWHKIFGHPKLQHLEEATGTYVNRNHFAGLLEMALPFALALILFRIVRHGRSARRSWASMISSSVSGSMLRDIVLFAVMAVALVFSRSRMGIVAALAGLLVVVTLALVRARARAVLAVALLALALPAAYAVWIGTGPVLERFDSKAVLAGDLRLPIWRDTLALIRDFPLLGTGLGTYHWASLHYQTYAFEMRYDHAHNDYLEFAADIGIPAAILLFAGLWLLVAKTGRAALTSEHSEQRAAAAGCAGALAALLVHGITDFNLQIPGNALFFSWLAGTALALMADAESSPHDQDSSRVIIRPERWSVTA